MSSGYDWAVIQQHVSRHVIHPQIQLQCWQHLTSDIFQMEMSASVDNLLTYCRQFQLRLTLYFKRDCTIEKTFTKFDGNKHG